MSEKTTEEIKQVLSEDEQQGKDRLLKELRQLRIENEILKERMEQIKMLISL